MEYQYKGQIESPILHRNHYEIIDSFGYDFMYKDIYKYCFEGIVPENYSRGELSIFNNVIISIETAWRNKTNGSKGGSKGGLRRGVDNPRNEGGTPSNKNKNNNSNNNNNTNSNTNSNKNMNNTNTDKSVLSDEGGETPKVFPTTSSSLNEMDPVIEKKLNEYEKKKEQKEIEEENKILNMSSTLKDMIKEIEFGN